MKIPCPECPEAIEARGLPTHVRFRHPKWNRKNNIRAYIQAFAESEKAGRAERTADEQATDEQPQVNGKANGACPSHAPEDTKDPIATTLARAYVDAALAEVGVRRKAIRTELTRMRVLEDEDGTLAHQESVLHDAAAALEGKRVLETTVLPRKPIANEPLVTEALEAVANSAS